MKTLHYVALLIAGLAFILAGCSDNSSSSDNSSPSMAPAGQVGLLKTVTTFTMTGIPMYGPSDSHVDATDPRVTGMMHVVRNATGNTHEHGTFTITPDAGGGVWEGTWQGQVRNVDPGWGRPSWIREWRMAGSGRGGAIDRLQLSITATSINGYPPNAEGSMTAR